MKPIFAAALIAAALTPAGALAQERVGDAALGAVSGAVVLGPVGAAAGGRDRLHRRTSHRAFVGDRRVPQALCPAIV